MLQSIAMALNKIVGGCRNYFATSPFRSVLWIKRKFDANAIAIIRDT